MVHQEEGTVLYHTGRGHSTVLYNTVLVLYCVGWQVKGQGYALSTEEELQLVKEVAEATGIVLDPVYRSECYSSA